MPETKRKLGDVGWIEFKSSGYPFGLRKKLQAATDDTSAIDLIKSYIINCSVPKLDGSTLTVIGSTDDLDDVDERVVAEIIYQYYEFRGERNREPLPKRQLAALAGYMRGDGGVPAELTEADIVERYGWTFDELDVQDEDRVYNAFSIQNVRDSADRIKSWLASFGKLKLSGHDWRLYKMIVDAETELGLNRKAEPSVEGLDEFMKDNDG